VAQQLQGHERCFIAHSDLDCNLGTLQDRMATVV
jgi:hypothetical protein